MSSNFAFSKLCHCGTSIVGRWILILERAVTSVIEKEPEMTYVKGGLFAKGVGLPKPAVETFWRRAESWEVPVEGAQVVD